jgi:hypothetical protein
MYVQFRGEFRLLLLDLFCHFCHVLCEVVKRWNTNVVLKMGGKNL